LHLEKVKIAKATKTWLIANFGFWCCLGD